MKGQSFLPEKSVL
jgi:hypothetical protein